MHYTIYTTHYTVHSTHYKLHTIHYTLYIVHCTLYTMHDATRINYTLYTMHHAPYTVHYTMCIYDTIYTTALCIMQYASTICTPRRGAEVSGAAGIPGPAQNPLDSLLFWPWIRIKYSGFESRILDLNPQLKRI